MDLKLDEAKRLAAALLTDPPDPSAETESEPEIDPGLFVGFKVRRLIGVGGMGEVYQAEQDHPRRVVALKVIRPELISEEAARRFDHEARILGRLQHPGIAQIYEAGRSAIQGAAGTQTGRSRPFFAMEFVEGKPLVEYAAKKNLGVHERLDLFLKVCDAVEHAHRKGVIHRDLKPANILVDAAGQPRVLDFGVARATDADIQATTMRTDMGRLIGTLPYMSPEQVGGDPDALDTRSDVYSLGIVLYELLGGRRPYDIGHPGRGAAGLADAARIIRETEAAPLSSIDRSLRGDVETIVAKALEKDRERRYQSVGALAADVRRYLNHEAIEARPASVVYQIRKFARRNQGLFLIAVLAGAVLLAATAVSLYFAYSAHRAQLAIEQEAATSRRKAAIAASSRDFLRDALISVDPRKLGRDAKVTDMLDAAAAKLEASPPNQPEAEFTVRHALGIAYRELGNVDAAIPQLRLATDQCLQSLGPDDPETYDVMNDLAMALQDAGAKAEAESLLRRVLDARRRLLGNDDHKTWTSTGNLGEILIETGRLDEAEPLITSALENTRRLLGDRSPHTLTSMQNAAGLYFEMGRYKDAEKVLRDQLRIEREIHGPDDPDVLGCMGFLAGVLVRQGRAAEALDTTRQLVDANTRVFGDQHFQTLNARGNLAGLLFELRQLSEARAISEALLADESRLLGAAHPGTLGVAVTLAKICAAQGELQRAESVMGSAVDAALTDQTDGPPLAAHMRMIHADYLRRLHRYEEAASEAELSLRVLKSQPGGPHPLVPDALQVLVHVYEDWGKPDKAAEYRALLPGDKDAPPQSAPSPASQPK